MKRKEKTKKLLLVVLGVCAIISPVNAAETCQALQCLTETCSSDSCADGITAKACHPTRCHKCPTQTIHIPKGQTCWSYQGRDTNFTGHFGSWSNVTVVAYGEFFENKGRDVRVENIAVDAFESRSWRELGKAGDGSYPTPEGGDIDITFVIKLDDHTDMDSLKALHFHVCSVPERMSE
jgi:hypothetical protein